MAWHDLDGWDAGGVGAEIASKGLDLITSSLNNLIKTANDIIKLETIAAIQTHEMAKAWDKVTTTLYDELTIIEKQTGNQMVLARIETVKTSLANIDWYNDFTSTVKPMAVKIEGIAKNLGTTVAAAEVLWEMKDPNVTSFELGSTAMGALTGVLVGTAILSLLITGPWALGAAAIGGIAAGLSGKYLWETGIYNSRYDALKISSKITSRNGLLILHLSIRNREVVCDHILRPILFNTHVLRRQTRT